MRMPSDPNSSIDSFRSLQLISWRNLWWKQFNAQKNVWDTENNGTKRLYFGPTRSHVIDPTQGVQSMFKEAKNN